jgi:hypothetical protein
MKSFMVKRSKILISSRIRQFCVLYELFMTIKAPINCKWICVNKRTQRSTIVLICLLSTAIRCIKELHSIFVSSDEIRESQCRSYMRAFKKMWQNGNPKLPHCRNSSKYNRKSVERSKIYTLNTQILSLLGTALKKGARLSQF